MKIFVPREKHEAEVRVALVPADVKVLNEKGAEILIEKEAGRWAGHPDAEYKTAGAIIESDREHGFLSADIVLSIEKPGIPDIEKFKSGLIHISYLDPFHEIELVDRLAAAGVSAVSLEMIPRITRAQKMDVLSSQASIAGYNAVIQAARYLTKVFPMMMTPAGTISPSRVFVIGAGVAGLQAIATAKRLGARVEAFDTRPVVEEQVKSLGARFVKIDLGETGQTKDGYAKALTPEQIKQQQKIMAKHCSSSDVVITTAQVFGRKAPRIISEDMIKEMQPGSIIVDMAVESGGNVEGSVPGKCVKIHDVCVLGFERLAAKTPYHASQMFSSNLLSFLKEGWSDESCAFRIDTEEEILKGCLITHQGKIVNETILNARAGGN
jgi:NAD(P) transhydrogenase subunit alpha